MAATEALPVIRLEEAGERRGRAEEGEMEKTLRTEARDVMEEEAEEEAETAAEP